MKDKILIAAMALALAVTIYALDLVLRLQGAL